MKHDSEGFLRGVRKVDGEYSIAPTLSDSNPESVCDLAPTHRLQSDHQRSSVDVLIDFNGFRG